MMEQSYGFPANFFPRQMFFITHIRENIHLGSKFEVKPYLFLSTCRPKVSVWKLGSNVAPLTMVSIKLKALPCSRVMDDILALAFTPDK